mgnify:FL=1
MEVAVKLVILSENNGVKSLHSSKKWHIFVRIFMHIAYARVING